jgi:hypothetical protein
LPWTPSVSRLTKSHLALQYFGPNSKAIVKIDLVAGSKERIAKLRNEIAQISEENRLWWHGGKKKIPGAAGD